MGKSLAYIYRISVSLMRVIWYLLWITELWWYIIRRVWERFLVFSISLSLFPLLSFFEVNSSFSAIQ